MKKILTNLIPNEIFSLDKPVKCNVHLGLNLLKGKNNTPLQEVKTELKAITGNKKLEEKSDKLLIISTSKFYTFYRLLLSFTFYKLLVLCIMNFRIKSNIF